MTASPLRDHLADIAAGKVKRPDNMPSDDTIDVSIAIRDCVRATLGETVEPMAAPSDLLPLLP